MGYKLALAAVTGLILWCGTAEAAPLPKVPTGYAAPVNLAIRPSRILITGDGSGLVGGFTGHPTATKRNQRWGRLHWTKRLPARAYATGAEWIDNGIPDVASGTFHPYPATVLAFRPRADVFTRLRVAYVVPGHGPGTGAQTETFKAEHVPASQYGPAYWDWL